MKITDRTDWLRNVERDLNDGVPIKCAVCGREFVAHAVTTKYCSDQCRNDAVAQRRMQRRAAQDKGSRS